MYFSFLIGDGVALIALICLNQLRKKATVPKCRKLTEINYAKKATPSPVYHRIDDNDNNIR